MKTLTEQIKTVNVKECVPNSWNPNEMNARQFSSLKKAIIDELIALAANQPPAPVPQATTPTIEDGVRQIEEGLAIIKRFI